MKSWLTKALHGLVPAVGAAVGAVAVVLTGGTALTVGAVAKIAAGAFLGYMVKKARPADPPTP
jgi:zinc transporter ZupT